MAMPALLLAFYFPGKKEVEENAYEKCNSGSTWVSASHMHTPTAAGGTFFLIIDVDLDLGLDSYIWSWSDQRRMWTGLDSGLSRCWASWMKNSTARATPPPHHTHAVVQLSPLMQSCLFAQLLLELLGPLSLAYGCQCVNQCILVPVIKKNSDKQSCCTLLYSLDEKLLYTYKFL
jgi:hypothetical protein